MLQTLCVSFSVKIWSKEAQGWISNIYSYFSISMPQSMFFLRENIIEIWSEINFWWTNSSINGSKEEVLTEIVGYFCNIGAKIWKCVINLDCVIKILLELSINLNHSSNSWKTSVALEIFILSNLGIPLKH